MGLAKLLVTLVPAPHDGTAVIVAALVPCAAAALASVVSARAVCLALVACLIATGSVMAWCHEGVASGMASVAQVLATQEATGAADATAPLALACALISTLVSFLTLTCRASWVVGLAAVPLLVLGPQVGRPADLMTAALLAGSLAALRAHDLVSARGGRPAPSALLAGVTCLACLAVASVVALSWPDSLAAPARALQQRAAGLAGDVARQVRSSGIGSRATGGSAGGSATRERDSGSVDASLRGDEGGAQATPPASEQVATSGDIRRDALGDADESPHEVTLPRRPDGPVYLASFRGQDFDGNAWGTATGDDPGAFLAADAAALPRLAGLVSENPQPDAAGAETFALSTLASQVTYTTAMAPIPDDASIPEYVLFDGHEGYCQHFATIATLMLRLYGVPARYVAGYAAPASAFSQGEDGLWHAWLDGRSAHAWVEVWDAGTATWQVLETTPPDAGAAPTAEYGVGAASAESDGGDTASAGSEPAAAPSAPEDATPEVTSGPTTGEGQDAADAGATTPSGSGRDANPRASDGSEDPSTGVTTAGSASSAGTSAAGENGTEAAGAGDGADAEMPASEGTPDGTASQRPGATPLAVALTASAAALLLLGGALAARRLRVRRERILALRAGATADALLAEALAALAYAGMGPGPGPADDGFADALARAVPGLSREDAEHLTRAALAAAFGPSPTGGEGPADARCHAAYDACAARALAALRGRRRLAFVWWHGWA